MRSWVNIAFILIAISAQAQTEYPILWENLDGVVADYPNETLEKTNVSGWGNGGAFSNNTLKSGVEGYVTYTVENEVGFKIFGLSKDDPDSYQTTVEYGFYFDLNRLYILEDGVVIGQFGNPNPGDVLKIRRKLSRYQYFLNGNLIRQVTGNAALDMHVDMAMYHQGLHFNGAKASFDHELHVEVEVSPLHNDSSGVAVLTVSGGEPPYSYFWGDGWVSEQSWDSLLLDFPVEFDMSSFSYSSLYEQGESSLISDYPGKINVRVRDSVETTYLDEISLAYLVELDSLTGVVVEDNVITRTASTGSSFKAKTKNGLHFWETGRVEFSVSDVAEEYHFGFNTINATPVPPGMLVKYGVHINAGTIKVSNGVDFTQLADSLASPDDIIGIILGEDEVQIELNGEQVHAYGLSRSDDLILEAVIYKLLGSIDISHIDIKDVKKEKTPKVRVYDADCAEGTGSISVQYQCTGGGIEYLLVKDGVQGGQMGYGNSVNYSLLSPGLYHLTISSTNCATKNYDIEIGYKIDWNNEGVFQLQGIAPGFNFTQYNVGNESLIIDANNKVKPFHEGWVETILCDESGSLVGTHWDLSLQSMAGENQSLCRTIGPYVYVTSLDINGNWTIPTSYNFGSTLTKKKLHFGRTNDGYAYIIADNFFESPGDLTIAEYVTDPQDNWLMPMLKPTVKLYPEARLQNSRASFACSTPSFYTNLNRKLDSRCVDLPDNMLRIVYHEEYADHSDQGIGLRYWVYKIGSNFSNPIAASNTFFIEEPQFGDNRYDVDVGPSGMGLDPGDYVLEIKNIKDEKWFLRFHVN